MNDILNDNDFYFYKYLQIGFYKWRVTMLTDLLQLPSVSLVNLAKWLDSDISGLSQSLFK